MSLTINIYYTGKNGSAKKFAEEMVLLIRFVPKMVMKDMNTFFQWKMKKQ